MQLSDMLDKSDIDALNKFKTAERGKPRFLRQMKSHGVQLVEIYDGEHNLPRVQCRASGHFLPEERQMIVDALQSGQSPENGTLKLHY